jgi:N-acetylglucosaminyldiphosphoundecaprenol N-acetyl-beta-D-mannosaminyltransferase
MTTNTGSESDRAFILGIAVSPVTLEGAVSIIEGWIERRTQNYVCVTGAHGVIESRDNPGLRAIHNAAGLVVPDGMPLVFMLRRLGHHAVSRVYGPDLMRRLTQISAQRGYRQFYYGGGEGLADRLATTLRTKYPTLEVVGTLSPPFRPLTSQEDDAVIDQINLAAPDIVWIGLSTPKQELWMASHVGRIKAPVLVGVGAAFDFLSGTKSQAPAWMQRSGLEWIYRLLQEPRRLWRRYARIVPLFLLLGFSQLVAHRTGRGNRVAAPSRR